jgi:hypothetical protein
VSAVRPGPRRSRDGRTAVVDARFHRLLFRDTGRAVDQALHCLCSRLGVGAQAASAERLKVSAQALVVGLAQRGAQVRHHEQRLAAGLELLDEGTPELPDDLAGFVPLVLDLNVERRAACLVLARHRQGAAAAVRARQPGPDSPSRLSAAIIRTDEGRGGELPQTYVVRRGGQ